MPATLTGELVRTTGGRPPGEGGDSGSGRPGGGGDGRPMAPAQRRAYHTGIWLGMAAITMFFMSLVSAFIVRKGISDDWRLLQLPRVLWLNTTVLLVSSVSIEAARRRFASASFEGFRRWWALTILLGLGFLAGQILAWRDLAVQGIYVDSNPASSFFYLLTAAHGLHIIGGLIALGYVAVRGRRYLERTRALSADVAAIYWHFMGGLWVFLLILLQMGR